MIGHGEQLMVKYMVTVASKAKVSLTKVRTNEKRAFLNALHEIAGGPTENRLEITFLSRRGRFDAYRYRATVGNLVYLVDNTRKEILIIDIQPFRR